MSDYMQYTQWKQREESLPRELEQARVIAERVAELRASRDAVRADRAARRTEWLAAGMATARRAFRRGAGPVTSRGAGPVTSRAAQPGADEPIAGRERELAERR